MNRHAGYTLVELMITVVVAGIVAAIAVPNFTETVRTHQLRSSSNDIYTLIRFARAEASRTGRSVVVDPVDGNDWSSGFSVTQGGDLLRRVVPSDSMSVTEKNGLATFTINGKGYLAAALDFRVCRNDGTDTGRRIRVLQSGFAAVDEVGGC